MKHITVNASVTPSRPKRPEVKLSQNDTDYTLTAVLYSDDGELVIESGTAAAFFMRRPDGSSITGQMTLTGSAAEVTTDADKAEITAIAGTGVMQVELEHDGNWLHSEKITVTIETRP